MKPLGPFDLLHQNQFFNGWPTLSVDTTTIVMAFPVEGWASSAAVTMKQENGSLDIKVVGSTDTETAKLQALAALSLDEDGSGWADVGNGDDFVASLQKKYKFMRPTLFHSPYEAATAFIIGHRITIAQTRKIRAEMSAELGEKIEVGGEFFNAFPTPQQILKLESFKGLNKTKIDRLHAVAQAAMEGLLERNHLRQMDDEAALAELETLPGVGPFFSQGILYRGVGKKDGFTQDEMTFHAIKTAYNLPDNASKSEILTIAEGWRPYRMWVTVLLHVWLRETNNFPARPARKR